MTVTAIQDFGTVPSVNVRCFIELARHEISGLIPDELWDQHIWPVGSSFRTKSQNRNNRQMVFYNCESVITPQQTVKGLPLHEGFVDFAKAYCRYKHSTSPSSFETEDKWLKALKLIEAGFRALKISPRIESCTAAVLNEAVGLAGVGVGEGRHYQLGNAIQQAHEFCLRKRFYFGPFQWTHGVRKPIGKTEALGPEARIWRDEKLPSMEALIGMGRIFAHSETFVDRLFSAVSAICACIPIRAHEVLQLRLDCEVEGKFKDEDSGEMREGYGLRVWPGKGHPPQVKVVPTKSASVVREAVNRLRVLCAEAREVATWYENNPSTLWLPHDLELVRSSDWIALSDLQRVVNRSAMGDLATWVRSSGIEYRSDGRKGGYMTEVRVSSLAAHVLEKLPVGFPNFDGRDDQVFSETLVVVFRNQLHDRRGTYFCLVDHATVGQFEHWLSGHAKKPSVYKRWGIFELDGSEIEITTHAFRHWLLTAAERNGVSELDMAFWSGHDVSQNKNYVHWTDHEIISELRALDDGEGFGPMFEASRKQGINGPVTRHEFFAAQIGSALATDFGYCVHDYSLLPCMVHGDCDGCSENVFLKGDVDHRAKVEHRLELTERQRTAALAAMESGTAGADRWVAQHTATIARLRRMIAIHDDPSIPDGTPVNLPTGVQDNEIALALRDRDALDGFAAPRTPRVEPPQEEEIEFLDMMRKLGDG